MNRNEEYQNMLSELAITPKELENTVSQAMARNKALQKKRSIFGIPAGTLAACFLGFVLLVNLFPPFAYACGNIPLLRDLAKAVSWSPSLSAAVENEYVQPINQRQTVNGITATMEFVIVDRKEVNIFFTLKGDGYEKLSITHPEFTPEQNCASTGSAYCESPGALMHFAVDYMEEDVPDHFTMSFGVYAETGDESEIPVEWDYQDALLHPQEEPKPDILAEFSFDLHFDPTYTAQGEVLPVGQTFELDGQTLTITDVEIYPTHMRVNIDSDEGNTAWLKGLAFDLVNEKGERFDTISNGISAVGNPDTPEYTSFWLESPYFAKSKHMTLCITRADWLDKENETVRIDLANQKAENLPQGVTLRAAQHRADGWVLEFAVECLIPDHFFNPFEITFFDAVGNEFEMSGTSTEIGDTEGCFVTTLPLPDYRGDAVWLKPIATRHCVQEIHVSIVIK